MVIAGWTCIGAANEYMFFLYVVSGMESQIMWNQKNVVRHNGFQYTNLPVEMVEHVKEAIHAIQAGKKYMEYGFGDGM